MKTETYNKFVPVFLRHWKQKYLCKFGFHSNPNKHLRTSTCLWCGGTIMKAIMSSNERIAHMLHNSLSTHYTNK